MYDVVCVNLLVEWLVIYPIIGWMVGHIALEFSLISNNVASENMVYRSWYNVVLLVTWLVIYDVFCECLTKQGC